MSAVRTWFDDLIEDWVNIPAWACFCLAALAGSLAAAIEWLLTRADPVFCFLAGAVFCLVLWLLARERRRSREALLDGVAEAEHLRQMSWRRFEAVVGQALRGQGMTVYERGGFRADGGVDLVADGRGGRYLIQCKRWRRRQLGVDPVRALAGVVAHRRAAGGILVTCATPSATVLSEARRYGVRIIDGGELVSMIGTARAGQAGARSRREPVPQPTAVLSRSARPVALATGATAELASADTGLRCRGCGQPMVKRRPRAGGEEFWGCSSYPRCHFTAHDGPRNPAATPACPRCGSPMLLKVNSTSYRPFWGCSGFPGCFGTRMANLPA